MGFKKRNVYRVGLLLLVFYLLATFVFISIYLYQETKYPKVETNLDKGDLTFTSEHYRYEFEDIRPGQIEVELTEYATDHILGVPISDSWNIRIELYYNDIERVYNGHGDLSVDEWFASYSVIKFEIDFEKKGDYTLIIETNDRGTGEHIEFDDDIEIYYESSPTPLARYTSFTCFCFFPFILIVGVILTIYGKSKVKKEIIRIIPKEIELDEWVEWEVPESQDSADLNRYGTIGRIVGLINTISNTAYMITFLIALGLLIYLMFFTSEWTESCREIFTLLSGIVISFFIGSLTLYFALASFAQYKAGCYAVDGIKYNLTKTYMVLGIIGNFLKGSALLIVLYVALEAANWICCLGSVLFLFQVALMIIGIYSFIGILRSRNAFTS